MLAGHYEPPLVIVSVLVAVFASYTALTLASRVSTGTGAAWWIAGGAFAMGTGIWAMHFVGMLAFRLPIPLGYDLGITLASWLLPVLVSGLALWQLSRPQLGARRLVGSALLIGLGINLMHYLGMVGMRMQPGIVWDPVLVVASVLIAVAAAGAALWMAFRLRDNRRPHVALQRGAAAAVMGVAIAGMHYTGMAAANFPTDSICRAAHGGFTLTQLAVLVIVGSVGVLAIALLAAVYDARLAARTQVLEISERTARERQVLLEREREARAEAERLSAIKDEFLATLSHELRTPLNAVLGWVQLLRMKSDEATLRTGLDTIERNARLQAQLIEDLLDMSRIVAGKLRLDQHSVDLAAVIASAVETARPGAYAKGVELATRFDAPGARVLGDPARLEQVLWNLLSNAVKFTPRGGRVDVRLQRDGDWFEVQVSDTGAGIAPAFLPHVFERFRQADASTTRRHGGLGLGLSIVRQLAELHGGDVAAHSDGPGHGAVFTVRLPVAQSSDRVASSAATALQSTVGAPPQADLADMRILVVDDEADSRELLRALLAAHGADVHDASDAEEALRVLGNEPADVLVADIGMPEVDGYELMRRVRRHADPRIARMPALALTAFTRDEDRRRALQAGFDAHLPKPVDAAALLDAVKAASARGEADAALAAAARPGRDGRAH